MATSIDTPNPEIYTLVQEKQTFAVGEVFPFKKTSAEILQVYGDGRYGVMIKNPETNTYELKTFDLEELKQYEKEGELYEYYTNTLFGIVTDKILNATFPKNDQSREKIENLILQEKKQIIDELIETSGIDAEQTLTQKIEAVITNNHLKSETLELLNPKFTKDQIFDCGNYAIVVVKQNTSTPDPTIEEYTVKFISKKQSALDTLSIEEIILKQNPNHKQNREFTMSAGELETIQFISLRFSLAKDGFDEILDEAIYESNLPEDRKTKARELILSKKSEFINTVSNQTPLHPIETALQILHSLMKNEMKKLGNEHAKIIGKASTDVILARQHVERLIKNKVPFSELSTEAQETYMSAITELENKKAELANVLQQAHPTWNDEQIKKEVELYAYSTALREYNPQSTLPPLSELLFDDVWNTPPSNEPEGQAPVTVEQKSTQSIQPLSELLFEDFDKMTHVETNEIDEKQKTKIENRKTFLQKIYEDECAMIIKEARPSTDEMKEIKTALNTIREEKINIAARAEKEPTVKLRELIEEVVNKIVKPHQKTTDRKQKHGKSSARITESKIQKLEGVQEKFETQKQQIVEKLDELTNKELQVRMDAVAENEEVTQATITKLEEQKKALTVKFADLLWNTETLHTAQTRDDVRRTANLHGALVTSLTEADWNPEVTTSTPSQKIELPTLEDLNRVKQEIATQVTNEHPVVVLDESKIPETSLSKEEKEVAKILELSETKMLEFQKIFEEARNTHPNKFQFSWDTYIHNPPPPSRAGQFMRNYFSRRLAKFLNPVEINQWKWFERVKEQMNWKP